MSSRVTYNGWTPELMRAMARAAGVDADSDVELAAWIRSKCHPDAEPLGTDRFVDQMVHGIP
jgi:hypothetical protein